MENKRYYFIVFKENDICFGVQVSLYPNLSLFIRVPFFEIRIGIKLK